MTPGQAKGASDMWPEPDMEVLRLHRRPPPALPIEVFGPAWATVDYHGGRGRGLPAGLCGGALARQRLGADRARPMGAGNARLGRAAASVDRRCRRQRQRQVARCRLPDAGRAARDRAAHARRLPRPAARVARRRRVRKGGGRAVATRGSQSRKRRAAPAPLPPIATAGPEPQAPRLRQNDVTIEKVADLLAATAPKGLLIVRDELAGWIAGMNAYNDAGRAFWIEAYGGRPYRVERQKHPEPIVIPRLAVAAYGGTQPDKLALLMRDADDGLLARVLWAWPEPIPFRLGTRGAGCRMGDRRPRPAARTRPATGRSAVADHGAAEPTRRAR